jgi:hypothetical protein
MDHFAGLDVSVKATSVCIVDDAGKIVREVKVASEPEALLRGIVKQRSPSGSDAEASWHCGYNRHGGCVANVFDSAIRRHAQTAGC